MVGMFPLFMLSGKQLGEGIEELLMKTFLLQAEEYYEAKKLQFDLACKK